MTQATKSRKAAAAPQPASPGDALQAALHTLTGTLTEKAVSSISGRLSGATDRLTEYAEQGGGGLLSAATGGAPVTSIVSGGLSRVGHKAKDAVKNALPGGKSKEAGAGGKITNIVEQIDVGVPIDLAYRQWTEFSQFPKFMKKVEHVEQISDEKLRWKAQVFLSHRSWEATITEQVPGEKIVWKSKGDKGYVDGAVTFHELAPNLTRVIVVLEYHPQGFFEKTGNLWRAQGRRVRLELKNFQREVMAHATLHPDDVEGWEGEIRDGEVVSGAEDNDGQDDEDYAAEAEPDEEPDEEPEDAPPPRKRRAPTSRRTATKPRRRT